MYIILSVILLAILVVIFTDIAFHWVPIRVLGYFAMLAPFIATLIITFFALC